MLDNQVDPTTGTIKLKATFPNPDDKLWPGAFVGVRLQVDTAKDAVVVPPAAVQRGPRSAYVYVVNADDTATRRNVTVGHEDAAASIITEGVKPGDKVVIDGAASVRRHQGDDRAAGGDGWVRGTGPADRTRHAAPSGGAPAAG